MESGQALLVDIIQTGGIPVHSCGIIGHRSKGVTESHGPGTKAKGGEIAKGSALAITILCINLACSQQKYCQEDIFPDMFS